MSEAYRVEQGRGCERCGHGALWDVIDLDGIAMSISWEQEQDARDTANILNIAYDRGCAAASRELPAHVREKMVEQYREELRKDAEMSEHIEVLRRVNGRDDESTARGIFEALGVKHIERACDGRLKLLRITVA